LKRLYVHKAWTLNYIANVYDRVGNVHNFVVLFRAMSTNPVDNTHDFVVLFRAISRSDQERQIRSFIVGTGDYNVTVEYESL